MSSVLFRIKPAIERTPVYPEYLGRTAFIAFHRINNTHNIVLLDLLQRGPIRQVS